MSAQKVYDEVQEKMNDWNCTELEAVIANEIETDSLEDTRKFIAQAVTYQRHLVDLMPESLRYYREEVYKGKKVDADFLESEAKAFTAERAEMYVYLWEQYVEYSSISAKEIMEVFGLKELAPARSA